MKIEKEWLKVQTTFEEIELEWIDFDLIYTLNTEQFFKSLKLFKDTFLEGDELWRYTSPKLPLNWQEGYCIVRNGEIINYFRTRVS